MSVPTFESVLDKIKSNFPKRPVRSNKLRWARETSTSLVTACNRYRITKVIENGTPCYFAWTVATPTTAPQSLGIRHLSAKEAMQQAQEHSQ